MEEGVGGWIESSVGAGGVDRGGNGQGMDG